MIQRWCRALCVWLNQPLQKRQSTPKYRHVGVLYTRFYRVRTTDSLLLWACLNSEDNTLVSARMFLGRSSSWVELPDFSSPSVSTCLFLATLEKKASVLCGDLCHRLSDEEFCVVCRDPEVLIEHWEQERRGNSEPVRLPTKKERADYECP